MRASKGLSSGHHSKDRNRLGCGWDGRAAGNGVGGAAGPQHHLLSRSPRIGGRVAPPPHRQRRHTPRAAPAQSSPSSASVAIRCAQHAAAGDLQEARSSRGDGQSADGCGGEGGRRGCAVRDPQGHVEPHQDEREAVDKGRGGAVDGQLGEHWGSPLRPLAWARRSVSLI